MPADHLLQNGNMKSSNFMYPENGNRSSVHVSFLETDVAFNCCWRGDLTLLEIVTSMIWKLEVILRDVNLFFWSTPFRRRCRQCFKSPINSLSLLFRDILYHLERARHKKGEARGKKIRSILIHAVLPRPFSHQQRQDRNSPSLTEN